MLWTLKKIWYRIFQFFLTSAMYLMPWRQPELLTGPGSIKSLPSFIRRKGLTRVLIVTDPVLHRIGLLNSLFSACEEAGLAYTLFDGVEPNPSIENIEEARRLYVENKCEGIVAFGGGSSMDCAKAAGARVVKPRQSVSQMGGTLRVLKRLPPVFAVPTTAGTGSETTIAAVVTDRSTHHKYAVQDLVLIPHYAVLDPELTVGLPPHITSTTGMDALTHAVEAYTNILAPKSTDILAEKAVKLIFDNLEKAYADGTDLTARYNMQLAAFYGGAAFTRACVGYVHGVAHTLGGLYGTPHGLANAVILPYVMEAFGPAVYYKLARLAEIVGIQGKDDEEKAKAFIREIRRMNTDMHIQDKFDFIEDKDIPQMIKWAMKEANPIYPVPVLWHEPEFQALISRIRAS
ncbi:MAG: iron-containing alcohol dehydrogenase [Eubacteriales bacterium]|nr:iron-containing alcohol dehydrogenase [Eubacteriales bacterium]